jgi:type IV secretory pathway VirJ component
MFLLRTNKFIPLVIFLVLILVGLMFIYVKKNSSDTASLIDEQININNQQKLRIVHKITPEKGLLIYLAQGHTKTTEEYARQFASLSYYVAIIDNQTLLNSEIDQKKQCLNLAEKLSDISRQIKSHLNIDTNELPILVGTDESAASIYAAIAQASEHIFHAAVSINFSKILPNHSPLCGQESFIQNTHNQQLIPIKRLPTSLYTFQNGNALPNLVDAHFAENISNLKLTISDEKKQTAQTEAIQVLQWLDPRLADQISSDASGSDLPLIEVPSDQAQLPVKSETLAIILTGDGGWAEIDKNIAKLLAENGVSTVALDSLSYFWKMRTPDETAKDVGSIISQYLEKWHKKKVILIGYSFGADVLPFVVDRFNAETRNKIALIALLGMGETAAFEFRLSSWMNADTDPHRLPILPEIEKMTWANTICIYGIKDTDANCLPMEKFGIKVISMPGDHHFDKKYDDLVRHILENEKLN